MKSHHDKIRTCLAGSLDGMSISELAQCTQIRADTLRKSLTSCFGVYVDRFDGPFRGQWRAVYMLVEVPEDAPLPEKKRGTHD